MDLETIKVLAGGGVASVLAVILWWLLFKRDPEREQQFLSTMEKLADTFRSEMAANREMHSAEMSAQRELLRDHLQKIADVVLREREK